MSSFPRIKYEMWKYVIMSIGMQSYGMNKHSTRATNIGMAYIINIGSKPGSLLSTAKLSNQDRPGESGKLLPS